MIALGADHGGFALKEAIKAYFTRVGVEFQDYGTDSEESVDYAPIAERVARAVAAHKAEKGILCCGTGIGISIAKDTDTNYPEVVSVYVRQWFVTHFAPRQRAGIMMQIFCVWAGV